MSSQRVANQKQATEAFLDAWRRLSIEDIVALRTADCIQSTAPTESLPMPKQNNEEWVAALKPAFGMLSNFKVDVHHVLHDGETGKSVLHANTYADAAWGDYRNEHMFVFEWNEDGTKMSHITDMMDSAGMLKRMEMIKAWQAKQSNA